MPPSRSMTLRRRLVLLAGAAVAIAVCAAAIGSYVAVRNELRGQVDDELDARVERVERFATAAGGGAIQLPVPPAADGSALPDAAAILGQRILLQRISPAGGAEPLAPGEPPLPVTEAERQVASSGDGRVAADREVGGEHLRVLTVPLPGDGAIQLAESLEGVDDVLARLRGALVLVLAAGVGLAGLLAWLLSRTVIAPIAKLTEAAEHVGETQDLSRRIEAPGEDELGRLAARFNSMLEAIEGSQAALERSVSAQRQLVADASHELRTPVAALRTDIETLIAHPDLEPDERQRTLTDVESRTEELGALIGDVIELARGDEPDGRVEELRLDEVVAECIARRRRLSPGREIVAPLEPTVVTGRADRLARAVNNLLDNADKYSPDGEAIEVSVGAGEVAVRDHGPGIAPRDLHHVFDRFWRGAGSRRQPGSGLGLAIVRQVADSHGGEAMVENEPGGGATFRIRLPVADGGGPLNGAR